MDFFSIVVWAFDHWGVILGGLQALINLVLVIAHLTNKANLAKALQQIEDLVSRVQINPADGSAQSQARLQNPKV